MCGFMPENITFYVFLPFLANHVETIFLLAGITVGSTEGVATIKPSGKEQKPVPDASKATKQLKMERGTVTSLWTRLFSQASLEWELT